MAKVLSIIHHILIDLLLYSRRALYPTFKLSILPTFERYNVPTFHRSNGQRNLPPSDALSLGGSNVSTCRPSTPLHFGGSGSLHRTQPATWNLQPITPHIWHYLPHRPPGKGLFLFIPHEEQISSALPSHQPNYLLAGLPNYQITEISNYRITGLPNLSGWSSRITKLPNYLFT